MTNPKPNYRIVGTDRFCSGYCPLQVNNSFVNDCGYKAWPGDHCILGLLDQRDQYKAENERLRTEIKEIGQAVDSLDKTSKDHIDRLQKLWMIK